MTSRRLARRSKLRCSMRALLFRTSVSATLRVRRNNCTAPDPRNRRKDARAHPSQKLLLSAYRPFSPHVLPCNARNALFGKNWLRYGRKRSRNLCAVCARTPQHYFSSFSAGASPTAFASPAARARLSKRGYGATVARLTPDQKVGSSNLSALILPNAENAALNFGRVPHSINSSLLVCIAFFYGCFYGRVWKKNFVCLQNVWS